MAARDSGSALVGYYGKIAQAADTEVSTGTLTADTKYIVKTIGGSSALPTGVEVGKSFVADGTEDISASGDVVIELLESDKCDVTTWTIDESRPEIDVSTLCDETNKYLTGRPDLAGNIEGTYKIGITDADDGVLNAFNDIVRQAGPGGAVTVTNQSDGEFILLLYKQKRTDAGDIEQVYVAPVVITSYSDGASGQDAQSFTSAFRISPNDEVEFHLLSVTHS